MTGLLIGSGLFGSAGQAGEAVTPVAFQANSQYATDADNLGRPIDFPTLVAGDLLILIAGSDVQSGTLSALRPEKTGWTAIGVATASSTGSSGDPRLLHCWYKYVDGDETDAISIIHNNIAVALARANACYQMIAVKNVPASSPIGNFSFSGDTLVNNIDAPSISVTGGSLVITGALAVDFSATTGYSIANGATVIAENTATDLGADKATLITGYKSYENDDTTGVFNVSGGDAGDHWLGFTIEVLAGEHTGNATPALDSDFASVEALVVCNSQTELLERSNSRTITERGTGHDYSIFGLMNGGSARGNSGASWYMANGTDFDLDGEFTIECFFYISSSGASGPIFSNWYNTINERAWNIGITSGTPYLYLSTSGTGAEVVISGGSPSISRWYHMAATRNSSDLVQLFFNGSRVATDTLAGALHQPTGVDIGIMEQNNGTVRADNTIWANNMRLTKGVCRYDGTSYTVPDYPFPIRAA